MRTRSALLCISGTGLVVSVWTIALAIAKLHTGAANALDLGIYTQVAWLTSHGHLFGFTIHPHLYLGDHVELLFALVAIPFRWLPSPITLVVVQCVAVVAAAFTCFRFARRILSTNAALGFGLLFLISPFTLNALAFEFHALLFGLPFAFLAATAYYDKHLGQFWIWCGLLLLVREDLALLVAGFAVIALLERRSRQWWLWPGLAAIAWYVGADALAGRINGEGYKFLSIFHAGSVHASTIGAGFLAAFTPANILVLIALIISVLGLPLRAWRWLALVILPWLGIGLAGFSSGDVILQTHYVAFFLPGLFCASILGWHALWQHPPKWLADLEPHGIRLVTIILVAVSGYSLLTFGPTISAARAWMNVPTSQGEKAATSQRWVGQTPLNTAVLAGYSTLPDWAARPQVYASHYAFLGKRQYSQRPYPIPDNLNLVVMDTQDFATYELQYAITVAHATDYQTGAARFRDLLASHHLVLTAVDDTLLKFQPGTTDLLTSLITRTNRAPLSGVEFALETPTAHLLADPTNHVTLVLAGQVGNPTLDNVQARLRWYDAKGKIIETRLLPLGYGLWPTSSWKADEQVSTTFTLATPKNATRGDVQALVPQGALELDGWRSAVPVLSSKSAFFGEPILLTVQR